MAVVLVNYLGTVWKFSSVKAYKTFLSAWKQTGEKPLLSNYAKRIGHIHTTIDMQYWNAEKVQAELDSEI